MKYFVSTLVVFALPVVVFAQQLLTFGELIERVGGWVGAATPILAGIALLVFFWGLVKFIASSGSDEGRKQGRNIMIWGIIALFVMVSIWGVVDFISQSLGIGWGAGSVNPPQINIDGNSDLRP